MIDNLPAKPVFDGRIVCNELNDTNQTHFHMKSFRAGGTRNETEGIANSGWPINLALMPRKIGVTICFYSCHLSDI